MSWMLVFLYFLSAIEVILQLYVVLSKVKQECNLKIFLFPYSVQLIVYDEQYRVQVWKRCFQYVHKQKSQHFSFSQNFFYITFNCVQIWRPNTNTSHHDCKALEHLTIFFNCEVHGTAYNISDCTNWLKRVSKVNYIPVLSETYKIGSN